MSVGFESPQVSLGSRAALGSEAPDPVSPRGHRRRQARAPPCVRPSFTPHTPACPAPGVQTREEAPRALEASGLGLGAGRKGSLEEVRLDGQVGGRGVGHLSLPSAGIQLLAGPARPRCTAVFPRGCTLLCVEPEVGSGACGEAPALRRPLSSASGVEDTPSEECAWGSEGTLWEGPGPVPSYLVGPGLAASICLPLSLRPQIWGLGFQETHWQAV